MEIKEIEHMWKQFDQKLSNLEKLNKEIIARMIKKKVTFRVNWMKVQGFLSLFVAPVIAVFVIYPMAQGNEWKVLLGKGVVYAILFYGFIASLIYFIKLFKINIQADTVVSTKQKILAVKKYFGQLQNWRMWVNGAMIFAIALIIWDKSLANNPDKVVTFLLLVAAISIWIKYKKKLYFSIPVRKIEQEIKELEELKR